MSAPDWWQATLLALAAYRCWRLLGWDDITEPARLWAVRFGKDGYRAKLAAFLQCGWCLGTWLALAWWAAWEAWPHGALVAAAPLAIAAAVGSLARLDG